MNHEKDRIEQEIIGLKREKESVLSRILTVSEEEAELDAKSRRKRHEIFSKNQNNMELLS